MKYGKSATVISLYKLMVLALLIYYPSYGQDTVSITSFDTLQQLVLEHNPDLKSYQLNIEKANKDLLVAKAYRLPSVVASFNSQNNLSLATTPLPGEIFGQPGSTINAQFGQEYTYNAGISLQKGLFDIEAMERMKKAKLGIALANMQEQNFQELLAQQACYYYHTALVAERSIRLWENDLHSRFRFKPTLIGTPTGVIV